ncbi:TonB-dependent receptor [Mesoterricola silvestris]|uniref:Outer membrane protein beta-barrel domain-containing protein n=1 Tax=Mesoterricola silvestris TaxID=2927979 RepID=A0AA48GU51_9BACT|nr:hypothetical protein [Mesoterricola silvestris]BDU71821.1 hypothetical protein METEAL_09950 [Mesoterricola silvestris]
MSTFHRHLATLALTGLALAPGAFAAAPAEASPVEVQFKLRSALGIAHSQDHLTRKTLGCGLEVGFNTSAGRFSAELGYQYKPGDQYREDVSTFPVAPGANPADPKASVDSRKTQLDGLTLRLAYGRELRGAWAWQAGVQIGGSRFRQEYLADVADANWSTWEDTYHGTLTHSTVSVSPYLGLVFRVNEGSSVELNLLGLRYTSANYVHVGGTVPGWGEGHTGSDSVALKSRMIPHVEIAYAIRF